MFLYNSVCTWRIVRSKNSSQSRRPTLVARWRAVSPQGSKESTGIFLAKAVRSSNIEHLPLSGAKHRLLRKTGHGKTRPEGCSWALFFWCVCVCVCVCDPIPSKSNGVLEFCRLVSRSLKAFSDPILDHLPLEPESCPVQFVPAEGHFLLQGMLSKHIVILLMEEIRHHLGCINCK